MTETFKQCLAGVKFVYFLENDIFLLQNVWELLNGEPFLFNVVSLNKLHDDIVPSVIGSWLL